MDTWNYFTISIIFILALLVIAEILSIINIAIALGVAMLIAYFIIAICLVIIAYYMSFLKDIAYFLMEISDSKQKRSGHRDRFMKKR